MMLNELNYDSTTVKNQEIKQIVLFLFVVKMVEIGM